MSSRVWKFGDHVDTDQIIPAEYLTSSDPKFLAKYAFIKVRPEFSERVKPGDVIVAGENFGSGSSREHAPRALIGAGISCVMAKSFARIFFRNSINLGLPVIELQETDEFSDGDEVEIDLERGIVKNLTTGKSYSFRPLPEFLRKIFESGGLIPYIKKKLQESGGE
ncbi:MAG: 3-isopropylmalate/(R)-2-methylmalate dehydratase small subunit [Archaeoglobi archaeon]|nr:3-isopropylmalate/(R)-2-methylmalate dehydratase small subunit [Archaeoglobi archaeon]